jgi:translocation and assembly module TamA
VRSAHRFGRLLRACHLVAGLLAVLAPSVAAQESSNTRLTVRITGIRDSLLTNVQVLTELVGLSRQKTVRPGHVYRLYDRAPEQIGRALQPFGYYHPAIRSSLDTDSSPWVAAFEIDPGPPVLVERLDIRVQGQAGSDSAFQATLTRLPLQEGRPLSHPAYEKAKKTLELLAADRGYLEAAWDSALIRVDLTANRGEIVLHMASGPRYRFGPLSLDRDWVDEDILAPYVGFESGDPYDASVLRDLQSGLAGTTYFANVEIVPRLDLADEELRVPIEIHTTVRKTQRWEVGVGYGTDTGPRIRFATEFRRLNRRGHYADGDVRLSTTEQSITARYNIPVGLPNPSLWSLTGRYGRVEWVTSKTLQGMGGVSFSHMRGSVREVFSVLYQHDDFSVASDTAVSGLTQPVAAWTYSQADNFLFATRGIGTTLELRGAAEGFGSTADFFRAWTSAKVIREVAPRLRGIVRADVGWLSTNRFTGLPPSIRFFAGGDRSIRGYDYQSLGPVDETGAVTGGNSLAVGSLELDYRFLEKWAVAVFVDAGNALDDFGGDVAVGTGFGARWISPVGVVRVDLGFGLDKEGSPLRLHLSIGPDF